MRFLLLLLPPLFLISAVTAAPTQPRQSVVPIPDVPDASLPPTGPEATPTATATVSPPPVVVPSITPEPDLEPSPDAEPSPGVIIPAAPLSGTLDGVRSHSANLASGLITLLLFLLAFLAFIFLAAAVRRDAPSSTEPNVYTSSAARPPAAPTDTTPDLTEHVYTSKDDARDAGPPVPVPPPPMPVEYDETTERDAGVAAPVAARVPTPPPHDYVVGAGPAATRTDFDDLRTKFERDEIGDNSAVLGATTGAGAMMRGVGEVGREDVGSSAHPIAPVPIVAAEEKAEKEGLPDRSGNVAVTFDSQERLMAGGDGSGQISDAALSLNAASIPEESADVPSLERDPIQVRRERDDTY